MLRTLTAAGVLISASALACASNRGSGAGDGARADQQLQGAWRLAEFVPETPFEPPLQGLLTLQFGTLTVTFTSGKYQVDGVGITTQGRYEVSGVEDAVLAVVMYDREGVAHRLTGEFAGSALKFHSLDAPWRGFGTLKRGPG